MQPKTVNAAPLAAQHNGSLPKPTARFAAAKKSGKSFLDLLRIALAAQVV
jgi:hypothetical protein